MRLKKIMPIIIVLLIIVAICLSIFIYYIFSRENIVHENVDNKAQNVQNEVAKNATPIIVNNILIGGIYEKSFVSAEKLLQNSKHISGIDLGVYTMTGKAGTYQLTNLEKSPSTGVIYANTTRLNYIEEYIGVIDSSTIQNGFVYEVTSGEEELKNMVKDATSKYMLPNNSVKLLKAYNGSLSENKEIKIITAISENANGGAYSTIVAHIDNKSIPIKLNYIKDKSLSSSWPVYNFKFLYDLNGDGVNEVVIEEVDEFSVKYSVMEYRNGEFYEVLSAKKQM